MPDLLYLLVYNSHNGTHIRIPKPIRFHTLVEFKRHVAQEFHIDPIESLFILSSFGIKLNFLLINDFSDVFVYDRRLFTPKPDIPVLQAHMENNPSLDPLPPYPLPCATTDSHDYLSRCADWASAAANYSSRLADKSKSCIKHINVICRSLNLIYLFCTNFVNEIQKSFTNYFSYIKLLHYKTLQKTWLEHLACLAKFPTIQLQSNEIDLASLLDAHKLKSASQFVGKNLPRVVQKFNDMSFIITSVSNEREVVLKRSESLRLQSINIFKDVDVDAALTEIHESVGEITKSARHASLLDESNAFVLMECSKLAALTAKMHQYFDTLFKFKGKLASDCLAVFSTIALLQKLMVDVRDELRVMTMPGDKPSSDDGISYELINEIKHFEDYMSLTIDLPLLFGYMLVEKLRQQEWNEVYSRGIVSNVSEQLSCLISHEDQARKLWIKKFGRFLEMVWERPVEMSIPLIDVTLVPSRLDGLLLFLDGPADRADIARYIKALESFAPTTAFAPLVDRQLKDLMNQSANLQKVSRVVSSISTVTTTDSNASKTSTSPTEVSNDEKRSGSGGSLQDNLADLDTGLVEGLKQRIKKLESLLHQQLYKNVSGWPVTRSIGAAQEVDTKMSLIVDTHAHGASLRKPALGGVKSLLLTNPTHLLQRRSTSESASKSLSLSKILDSSGIDKHLDNIRLKKENAELATRNLTMEVSNGDLALENTKLKAILLQMSSEMLVLKTAKEELEQDHDTKSAEIALLHEEMEQDHNTKSTEIARLHEEMERRQDEHDAKTNDLLTEITGLKNAAQTQIPADEFELRVAKHESCIKQLEDEIKESESRNVDLAGQVDKLYALLQRLKEDLNDELAIKKDLMSNLSSKEAECVRERNALELEIKTLQSLISEKTEDYEHLVEVAQSKQKASETLTHSLNGVVNKLFELILHLVNLNLDSFVEYCLALESMGLLLVKENTTFRITRVKGLRAKTGDSDELDAIDKPPASEIVDEFREKVAELSKLLRADAERSSSLASHEQLHESLSDFEDSSVVKESMQLIERFQLIHDDPCPLIKFYDEISFKHNVQIQDDKSNRQRFFVNAISKRFKDVEGFAKRQAKESKAKQQSMDRLAAKLNTSISVNNFQPKDLALFLPTRIESDSNHLSTILGKPWAAFNVGAPHYFLRSDGRELVLTEGKEWIVARILRVSESRVTQENYFDIAQNPFQLSVGISWFLVEAEEEML